MVNTFACAYCNQAQAKDADLLFVWNQLIKTYQGRKKKKYLDTQQVSDLTQIQQWMMQQEKKEI